MAEMLKVEVCYALPDKQFLVPVVLAEGATLHVNYHSVKTCFTTENHKDVPRSMRIFLVDGPFRRLEGSWHFRALAETACKIEFQLHYDFSSRVFEKAIGPVFSHIANTFVDAFVRRAGQVYGEANG